MPRRDNDHHGADHYHDHDGDRYDYNHEPTADHDHYEPALSGRLHSHHYDPGSDLYSYIIHDTALYLDLQSYLEAGSDEPASDWRRDGGYL